MVSKTVEIFEDLKSLNAFPSEFFFKTFVWDDLREKSLIEDFAVRNHKKLCRIRQVHGIDIVSAEQADEQLPADGMVSAREEFLLAVRHADCLPITVFDRKKKVWGLVHAGWKGIYEGILFSLTDSLRERFQPDFDGLTAMIGPGICGECYRVPEERKRLFFERYGDSPACAGLDLKFWARTLLMKAGIRRERIFSSDLCTFEKEGSLHSFRREGKILPQWTLAGWLS